MSYARILCNIALRDEEGRGEERGLRGIDAMLADDQRAMVEELIDSL